MFSVLSVESDFIYIIFACVQPYMIDTDRKKAGGTGTRKKRKFKVKKGSMNGYDKYISVSMPKLSAMILEKR